MVFPKPLGYAVLTYTAFHRGFETLTAQQWLRYPIMFNLRSFKGHVTSKDIQSFLA